MNHGHIYELFNLQIQPNPFMHDPMNIHSNSYKKEKIGCDG